MKEKMIDSWNSMKDMAKDGLEKARSNQVLKKVLFALLATLSLITIIFCIFRLLDVLYNTACNFLDKHFFGVTATAAGGSYLLYKHSERKNKQQQQLALEQKGIANQRDRFVKGCYQTVGSWLFSGIFSSPNFEALTSCQRPLQVKDMGNPTLDAYTYNGQLYNRFVIPKLDLDTTDTSLIKSAIQGLIDQRIRTQGLPPLIPVSDNNVLYLDSVEDMKTYVTLTFVLSFDDTYIQRVAYERAMSDVLNRTSDNKPLEDCDYHD